MKEYIFEKTIELDNELASISDIFVDNNFEYDHKDDGINIHGDININYSLISDDSSTKLVDKLPIDLFINLNEIDSLKDITLEIDDFTYTRNKNNLYFKIITKLKGNKEDFVFFELSPNRLINDKAISLLMRNNKIKDRNINLSKNDISNIEKMIKSSAIELISTSVDDIALDNDIIEINTFEEPPYVDEEVFAKEEDMINVESDIEDRGEEEQDLAESIMENQSVEQELDKPIIENQSAEEKLDEPILENQKEDQELEKKVIEKEEKPLINKESLFKETYESKYFYYVLKENDTKEELLKRFDIEEDMFDKINKNIEFKKGSLVRIIR